MRDESKMRAAERAVEYVRAGQVVGLGTGSTTAFAIQALGRLVREGLQITGVATSLATGRMAAELGIPVVDLNQVDSIDITIDGADEVDPRFDMIKGGGGALTREKLVAISSVRRVFIVDESKLVSNLGLTRSVPVEVLPFAWRLSARRLSELGCAPLLREDGGAPFITDNSNYILDCNFGPIASPEDMERNIKQLPGVVESGLFIAIADMLVVGFEDRIEIRDRREGTG